MSTSTRENNMSGKVGFLQPWNIIWFIPVMIEFYLVFSLLPKHLQLQTVLVVMCPEPCFHFYIWCVCIVLSLFSHTLVLFQKTKIQGWLSFPHWTLWSFSNLKQRSNPWDVLRSQIESTQLENSLSLTLCLFTVAIDHWVPLLLFCVI